MAIDRSKIQAQAQKFALKGQIDKAIKEYLLLYEDDPKDIKVCQKLGDLYIKKGSKKEAQKFQEKVAEDYTAKGFYLKAIAVYKQILRVDPSQLSLNLKLADLYNRQGLPNESVSQYRLVASQYEKSGKIREALSVIGQMADIDPSNVMVRVKLAERYVKEGIKDKAIEQILKAGEQYQKETKPDEIIKLFEKFLGVDQSSKAIHKGLAKACIEAGDDDKALVRLQQALQIDSDDMETLFLLTGLYKKKGETEKAKSSLQHILKIDSMSIEARKEIALIYLDEGEEERALSEYEMLVDLYLKDGLFDDALQIIEKLREKMPDNSRVMGKLCEIHWIMKDQDKLVVSYKELARLYAGQGEESKAREVYGRVLELRPADEEARKATTVREEGAGEEAVEGEKKAEAADETGPLSRAEVTKILTEVDVYLKYGMEDKVEEALQVVLKRNPDNIEARLKLKDFFVSQNKTGEAANCYFEAVNIYKKHGEEEKVIECLKDLLKINPRHEEAASLYKSLAGEEELIIEEEIPDEIELEIEDDEAFEIEAEEEESQIVAEAEEIEEIETLEEEIMELEPLEAELIEEEVLEEIEELEEEVIEELAPLSEEEEAIVLDVAAPLSIADVGELLEEAQFYYHQELFEKARASLAEVEELDPGNSEAADILEKIETLESQKICEIPEANAEAMEEDFFDLSAELADEIAVTGAEAGAGRDNEMISFDDLFDSFKAGVSQQVSSEDSETHYNLGIAYKEMGLFDDAIEEFKTAMRDPAKKFDSYSMLGLCSLDKGQPEDAIEYFRIGLDSEGITKEAELSLTYELGLAYKKANMIAAARESLEKVYISDKTFRDVSREYMEVKDMGIQSEGEEIPGMETVSEKDTLSEEEINPKDKVSYL